MRLLEDSRAQWLSLLALVFGTDLVQLATAATIKPRAEPKYNELDEDPFAVLDPQQWVNPDNMTWADWRAPPGTNWSDPSRRGSMRNFNIALVTVDYSDMPFTITLPAASTIFSNPQAAANSLTREEVPAFYKSFLNVPGELNRGHTLHEYWMGDSDGRFGVDLTAFGAYRMPSKSYQYGVGNDFNPNECPAGQTCNLEIRNDALGAWRADIGNATADSYELVFILSAGQDESSTWQEFGEMKFQTKDAVSRDFGPPTDLGNETAKNWAKTRYVEWTSWASASTIWPNAGGGSSTQAESSGMGTFAHELSHLLNIGDNYNNPYGDPLRRAYTGPWSMMSRGSFNGPGGPHTRWQIPPQQGGSMGSLHTLRDKAEIGLVGQQSILNLTREALASSGLVVAQFKARSVSPGQDLMGMRVSMDADNSPPCDIDSDIYCDGGNYNFYYVEVIDRMGADSFTPDSGVMISKTKPDRGTYQWTIDANPQDIELLDFHRPDGTPVMITLGDYRQLSDALFHAGTRSGSEFEYVDKANSLHFYIIEAHRDENGVLSYTTAVRSLQGTGGPYKHQVALSSGTVKSRPNNSPLIKGVTCSFQLSNQGTFQELTSSHPQDVSSYLKSDVFRLNVTVEGSGWRAELPNALVASEFGSETTVLVAVGANESAATSGIVRLTATSESDPSVSATGLCEVNKELNV